MRRTIFPLTLAALVLALPLAAAAGAGAADDVVMRAMTDELARSTAQLEMAGLSRPYFVAYRVDDIETSDAAASFGSLVHGDRSRSRVLTVEVRVGEPALDNSNFLSYSSYGNWRTGTARLPLDDSYEALRRQIWLATDGAFKQALEDLSRKKAALQNKTRTDEVPDFAAAEPFTFSATGAIPALGDTARAETLVRSLSGLFRAMPELQTSTARLSMRVVHSRYVNSEGGAFSRVVPEVRLAVAAGTQATDGMRLADVVSAYGRSLEELPSVEELSVEVKAMGARLAALRVSPLLDTYNGPVLFEGQAAAELLAQGIAPDLLALRQPVTDNERMSMSLGASESRLIDKLGARVLPRFLTLEDDPTRASHAGQALLGGYPVDDDGVPARRTEVVENGRLRTLLATRNPVRGVAASTGNRRGSGPAPSNLILTAAEGKSRDALRRELLAIAADAGLDYAVIVRRVANPVLGLEVEVSAGALQLLMGGRRPETAVMITEAVKLFPDGREELVRNLTATLGGDAFKDVVATSDTAVVHTLPFWPRSSSPFAATRLVGFEQPGDAALLVSVVSPALLFEEVTIKRPTGEVPAPPVARHPFFDEKRP